jgi:hypothetical protein
MRTRKDHKLERGSFGAALLRYAAGLSAVTGVACYAGAVAWDDVMLTPARQALAVEADPALARTQSAVLETDDWSQSLRTEKFWADRAGAGRKSGASTAASASKPAAVNRDFSGRSGLMTASLPARAPAASSGPASAAAPKGERTDASGWYEGDGGTHRTVCVRLCDGYFWPISFSTDSDHFDRDKKVCEKSCGSPTRLYIHENPGQDVDQMVDLKGQPYSKLRTAHLFRSNYDHGCTCNAHPWEQESKDRHRVYALEAEKRKGSQHAAAELVRLKSTVLAARKAAATGRAAGIETGTLQPPSGKRAEAPGTLVTASFAPLSSPLPAPLQTSATMPLTGTTVTVQSERPQQLAQMTAPVAPPSAMIPAKVLSDAVAPPAAAPNVMPAVAATAPPEPAAGALPARSFAGLPAQLASATVVPTVTLPASPFALPSGAPAVPVAQSAPQAAPQPGPQAGAAPRLQVVAPPIITASNDELGIKAPLAVNTAQLEQVNKPQTSKPEPNLAAKVEAKPEVKSESKPEAKSKSEEPAKRQRAEPRVVEAPTPRPRRADPEPERRAVVVRPSPPPRVVERAPPPQPPRVVAAPKPSPVARPRPQVAAVREDARGWRQRAFDSGR